MKLGLQSNAHFHSSKQNDSGFMLFFNLTNTINAAKSNLTWKTEATVEQFLW